MSDIYPGLLGARSIHANYLVTRNDPNSAVSHGCADPVGCGQKEGGEIHLKVLTQRGVNI